MSKTHHWGLCPGGGGIAFAQIMPQLILSYSIKMRDLIVSTSWKFFLTKMLNLFR